MIYCVNILMKLQYNFRKHGVWILFQHRCTLLSLGATPYIPGKFLKHYLRVNHDIVCLLASFELVHHMSLLGAHSFIQSIL